MSAYATRAQLYVLGVSQGALRDTPTADQDLVLEAVSRKVDGALQAAGYVLPLSSWDLDLTREVCILAACDLLTVRGLAPGTGENPITQIRYQQALQWIEGIRQGGIKPQVVDARATKAGTRSASRPHVISDVRRGYETGLFGGGRE